MIRIVLLVYYLLRLDAKGLNSSLIYCKSVTGRSKFSLSMDILFSVVYYKISITDYFQYKFHEKGREERLSYAGTGFIWEFHRKMNPQHSRHQLANKITFLNTYKKYVLRIYLTLENIEQNDERIRSLLENKSGRIVLKNSKGHSGAQVRVYNADQFNPASLAAEMRKQDFDLAEEFVLQHKSLMDLSPNGLNTLRIVTQIIDSEVIFLGAGLRITTDLGIDNWSAGNVAAPIDLSTGMVCGPGVYSDIRKPDIEYHPKTLVKISGFEIPYWDETIEMLKKVVYIIPENRSVGWDVAITNKGPQLIEGNHNWSVQFMQLIFKKGIKDELSRFI